MENNELLIMPLSETGRPNTEMEFFFFDSDLLDGVGKPTLTSIANDGTVRRYTAGGGGGNETLAETMDLGSEVNFSGIIKTNGGDDSVAVNDNILWSSGFPTINWQTGNLSESGNGLSINFFTRQLSDGSDVMLDWSTPSNFGRFGVKTESLIATDGSDILVTDDRALKDNDDNNAVKWTNSERHLITSDGSTVTLDWEIGQMSDSSVLSIDWQERKIYGSSQIQMMNYFDALEDGHTIYVAPEGAVDDSALSTLQSENGSHGAYSYRINEGANQMEFRVLYSDGITFKTGVIDLL